MITTSFIGQLEQSEVKMNHCDNWFWNPLTRTWDSSWGEKSEKEKEEINNLDAEFYHNPDAELYQRSLDKAID